MDEENTKITKKGHDSGMVESVHFQHVVLQTVVDGTVECSILQQYNGLISTIATNGVRWRLRAGGALESIFSR